MIIEVILYVHMHVHYIPLIDDHHIVTYIPIIDLTTGETIFYKQDEANAV